jgi:DedD protein
MALFKLRKKVDEPVAAASPAESIAAIRRRARHRLIGAVVLVLAGVIGFPLLFDTQPRPVAVDIPIEIPDRNQVKPLAPPPPNAVAAGRVTVLPPPAAPAPTPAPAPAAVITEKVEPPPPAPAAEEKVAKVDPAPEKKPEPKPEAKAEAKPEPKAAETAKARALLEGKSVDTDGARFVVQVGAFAEKDKARQAQQKLERAGLKNYTNVAETKNGTRIRVRAGPFASRAEADKAAEKIKGLDLPAAVLSL